MNFLFGPINYKTKLIYIIIFRWVKKPIKIILEWNFNQWMIFLSISMHAFILWRNIYVEDIIIISQLTEN